jgi:hypothetical protein
LGIWYDAGRWISEHPVRFAARSPSLVKYDGHVTQRVDPTGLSDRITVLANPENTINVDITWGDSDDGLAITLEILATLVGSHDLGDGQQY